MASEGLVLCTWTWLCEIYINPSQRMNPTTFPLQWPNCAFLDINPSLLVTSCCTVMSPNWKSHHIYSHLDIPVKANNLTAACSYETNDSTTIGLFRISSIRKVNIQELTPKNRNRNERKRNAGHLLLSMVLKLTTLKNMTVRVWVWDSVWDMKWNGVKWRAHLQ